MRLKDQTASKWAETIVLSVSDLIEPANPNALTNSLEQTNHTAKHDTLRQQTAAFWGTCRGRAQSTQRTCPKPFQRTSYKRGAAACGLYIWNQIQPCTFCIHSNVSRLQIPQLFAPASLPCQHSEGPKTLRHSQEGILLYLCLPLHVRQKCTLAALCSHTRLFSISPWLLPSARTRFGRPFLFRPGYHVVLTCSRLPR